MRFRDFHPNVRLRIIVAFVTGFIGNMIFPFMAIYFAMRIGESITGLLMILNVLLGVVSGFFGGYYADRIGRKKMMVFSEAVFVLSFLFMAIGNSPWLDSPTLTFFMMLLNSICWGFYGPASEAMLIDVTTSENRKYMYGIFYWTNNLSMAIGGILGAFLFKSYKFELFLAVTFVAFLSLLVTIFWISETHKPVNQLEKEPAKETPKQGIRDILHSYRLVLKDSTFMIYVLASCFLLSTEFHLANYIGVRLEKEMVSQTLLSWKDTLLTIDGIKMLGFLRTENTILVVLFAALVARLMKKFQDKKVFFIGTFLYVTGFTFLAVSNNPWVLFAVMLVGTLGEVMYVPIKQAFMGDLAPSNARSSYMAMNGLTFRGAMIISSIAISLGAILPSWVMGLLIFAVGLTAIILFQVIMPEMEKRRERTRAEEKALQNVATASN